MNPRTTLIIAALFVLIGGYVLIFEWNKPTPTPPPRPAPRVFDVPAGQVARLELRNLRTAQQVQLAFVDNAWQVEKPANRPADIARVKEIIEGFAQMQANRVITESVELSQFGVLSGTLEARMIMRDSTTYAITIGNKIASGESYYAIYTGSAKPVFIINARLVDEWLTWFDNPPYPPTPTPTFTPAPTGTPTLSVTQTPAPSATPTR